MKKFSTVFLFIFGCELVGIASTPFTIAAIPTWYATLNKPPFSPPNWLFGPVWIVLYALMGIAAYLVYTKEIQKRNSRNALNLFIGQLVCNFLWSIFFFGVRSPILGFVDILMLLVLLVLTIKSFYKISKTAAYLLIPYLFWVSFATLLNLSIIVLNGYL